MSFRMGFRPLMVCSTLFVISQVLPAQTKVGVVNLQRAVFESAEIKKADAQMQATFKPRQDEIDRLDKEIADLAKQLQGSNGKLSPQQESDLNAQGQNKQRRLKYLQDDLQTDATNYRNDVLSKSSQKMTEVVKKLAEEKGIDLVVDTSTTLYFKPALDLTNDAIAAYDKAYPVTAAPAKK
ncbi:MAG TPA: OmpH family outer membrane protein [Bryobacteraceae bacterium]|nr:OmpH family outer membrane protein [Bryobacteraceae bacterium]